MSTDDKTLIQLRTADGRAQTAAPIAGGAAAFARPNPGGQFQPPPPPPRHRQSVPEPVNPGTAAPWPEPGMQPDAMLWAEPVVSAADNPLRAAAGPLLRRMAYLNAAAETQDAGAYREACVQDLQRFERTLVQQDVGEEVRFYARYVLCTVLDELVNKTPWGSGVWSRQSLLSQFHGETGGGERFFQLLGYLKQSPGRNLHLLELMYFCLGLGFEGRYRLQAQGRAELETLREDLYHQIRQQRGEPEPDLSPHWQRPASRRNPLSRYLPLWVVAALVGVLMLATFSGFSYLLHQRSGAILQQLERPAQAPGTR